MNIAQLLLMLLAFEIKMRKIYKEITTFSVVFRLYNQLGAI